MDDPAPYAAAGPRFLGASRATLLWEKGTTPARLAISFSPICQCMASTARQGISISQAILCHISALNLNTFARQLGGEGRGERGAAGVDGTTFRKAWRACLFCLRPIRAGVPDSSDSASDRIGRIDQEGVGQYHPISFPGLLVRSTGHLLRASTWIAFWLASWPPLWVAAALGSAKLKHVVRRPRFPPALWEARGRRGWIVWTPVLRLLRVKSGRRRIRRRKRRSSKVLLIVVEGAGGGVV